MQTITIPALIVTIDPDAWDLTYGTADADREADVLTYVRTQIDQSAAADECALTTVSPAPQLVTTVTVMNRHSDAPETRPFRGDAVAAMPAILAWLRRDLDDDAPEDDADLLRWMRQDSNDAWIVQVATHALP